MTTFAELLVTYRTERRLTQTNMAFDTGLTRPHMSRLESGRRMPSRETVEKLAVALQLDVDDRLRFFIVAGFVPLDMRDDVLAMVLA